MAGNKKSGGMGGFKGALTTGFVVLLLASSVIGWAKVNDIQSVSSGYDYFKAWSDKLWSCGAADARLECDGLAPGSIPNSGGATGTVPNSGNDSSSGNTTAPTPPEDTKASDLDTLSALAVSDAQTVDYQRSEWKHWTGTPCDTRENSLFEQGENVTKDPSTCKALSGTWIDPYSGETFTDAGALDIDHVVPLGYAAKHGGQDWSPEKKQQFANDRTQLLAVSAKENRSKSDKGPENYMPPRREFQCEYSKKWVATATKYGITVTEGDKRALKAGLQKC
jgi:hypothetical protein